MKRRNRTISIERFLNYLPDRRKKERKVVTNGIFTATNDSETRHASSAVISNEITVNKESQRCDEPLFDSDFCLWDEIEETCVEIVKVRLISMHQVII